MQSGNGMRGKVKRYDPNLPAKEVLDRLPTNQFYVVCAYKVHGDYQKGAEQLGIKIGTFKSRLSRARKAIKQMEEASWRQPIRIWTNIEPTE